MHAWVMIDLKREILVRQITVFLPFYNNRSMTSFDIRIGKNSSNGGKSNLPCIANANPLTDVLHVQCPNGTIGRFVSVNVFEGFLEVCEIEVSEIIDLNRRNMDEK